MSPAAPRRPGCAPRRARPAPARRGSDGGRRPPPGPSHRRPARSRPPRPARGGPAAVGRGVRPAAPRAPAGGPPAGAWARSPTAARRRSRDLQLRVRVGSGCPPGASCAGPTTCHRARRPGARARAPRPRRRRQAPPSTCALAVDDLRLGDDGVYPLLLEVRGVRGGSGRTRALGQVSTYLPWFGTTERRPAADRLAVAAGGPAPLRTRRRAARRRAGRLVRPARAASGAAWPRPAPASPAPACRPPSRRRTAQRRPTRRRRPCRARPVPVTYAVDPDLLLTARTHDPAATGSTSADGRPPGRRHGGRRTAWLASLRAALGRATSVALPYADPDVVALTRGGTGLAADVATAQTYGVTVTRDVLGQPAAADGGACRRRPAVRRRLRRPDDRLDPRGGARRRRGQRAAGRRPQHPRRPGRAAAELDVRARSPGWSSTAACPTCSCPAAAAGRPPGRAALARRDRDGRGRAARAAGAPCSSSRRAGGRWTRRSPGAAVADTGQVPWMCAVAAARRRGRPGALPRRGARPVVRAGAPAPSWPSPTRAPRPERPTSCGGSAACAPRPPSSPAR